MHIPESYMEPLGGAQFAAPHARMSRGFLAMHVQHPPLHMSRGQSSLQGDLYRGVLARGSNYLIIKELGLKDHDYSGF